jgi:hypothetical protein
MDLIDRYFTLAVGPRSDYLAQFTADAVVEDEGRTHRGIEAVRAWRGEVPQVRYDVEDVSADGAEYTARTMVSGDFPGSPVPLTFRFRFTADGHIERLTIRP